MIYRWYEPYIWLETEIPVWKESIELGWSKRNMFFIGRLWYDWVHEFVVEPWVYPMEVWKEKFKYETLC